MHEHQIKRSQKTTHETETNSARAAASLHPGQSTCSVGSDSDADLDIDHDGFEPGILFRPRLYLVPE